MSDRPIIFSAAMVRAILAGRKSQTRRVLRVPGRLDASAGYPDPGLGAGGYLKAPSLEDGGDTIERVYPPYEIGDRLWVRETWQVYDWTEDGKPCIRYAADNSTAWPDTHEDSASWLMETWEALSDPVNYGIDNRARDRVWRPSILMPRWASRVTLQVTDVRVERLQSIADGDAWSEGVEARGMSRYACESVSLFRSLWDSINSKRPGASWNDNPWVAAITFTSQIKNIDSIRPATGEAA